MKNQKNSKAENYEIWESGTYQTGNTTPPKKGSILVTALLMLVIFLGGMLSAMGIINLRLLAQLQQQKPTETVPVQLQPGNDPTLPHHSNLELIPSVPSAAVSMELAESELPNETNINPEALMRAGLVSITTQDTVRGHGLVLTDNGYILTFAHLVDQADRIIVEDQNGRLYRAALVGIDPYTDLAVVYIHASSLQTASFGTADKPETGSKVTALCGNVFSGGTVFVAEENLTVGSAELPLLQTSAATGETAGFLFSSRGQVLGLISHRITTFVQGGEGLAYTLPNVVIKHVVDQLLAQGYAAGRPAIGCAVEEVTDVYQNYWKLPDGLRLTDVTNPALREGDILTAINGNSISTKQQLHEILIPYSVGQTLQANVYRDGHNITVEFTLQEQKE